MPNYGSTGNRLSSAPVRIAGFYAVVGFLWIWLSDWALNAIGFSNHSAFLAGAVKGTFFVLATAAFLYWLVRREMAEVRKSQYLLRAVISGTEDAVFVKDMSGRYLLANEATAQLFGRTVSEIVGRSDRELFDAENASRVIESDESAISCGKPVTLEETITSRGRTRTYLSMKAPLRNEEGVISGVIGIARDITERKKSNDAIKDSEQRYRQLADAIPQIVWTASPDGAVTHLNLKAVEYSGLAVEDLAGWSWQTVVHPDDLEYALSIWLKSLREGVPHPFEMRIRRADGEYRWHAVQQQPICDSSGDTELWIGTCTDIDDLKRAEESVKKTEKRFLEAQRIAGLGSWDWEPQSDTVTWSEPEFELFGMDPKSTQPGFNTFLELLHPDDRPIALARVASLNLGMNEFANDMRVIRPDGRCLWIHSRARATRDADGRIVHVEGTDQDITEIVNARMQLRAERDRFEKLMEAVPLAICSFRISTEGQVTMPYASPRIEPFYGIPPAQLSLNASGVFAAIHPDDVERVRQSVMESSRSMTVWRDEFRVRSPKLGEIWIEGSSVPARLDDGSVIWHGYVNDVTARKRTEDALRASEKRLRLVLEAAGSLAFTWDIQHDAIVRYFSAEPGLPVTEETLGTLNDVRRQVHPDDLDGFDSRLAASLKEGVDYHNSFRIVRPDGAIRYLEEYRYIDRNADGTPLALTGISIDVSEREEATAALRASEARYRQLVDLLPTAIFVYVDDKIIYGNPAYMQMVGAKDSAEFLGRSPFDVAHVTAHEAIQRRNLLMAETGKAGAGFEKQVVRLDGRLVPVYSVAAPITAYGQPATLVAVTDLTERERATQLLRSVLSNVGDAIFTINEHGVIGSANPAAVKQFGYSEDELVGQNVSVLMHQPFKQEHKDYFFSYLKTGVPQIIGVGREVECRRRDGTHFPADLTVTEFLLEGQRRFTGVLRDVTEKKRLQSQFIQSQKMEAVGRLAGGVAHDFNNLLTIISGYCELLLMSDFPAGDKRRESIAIIREAGERAARLTQQLLAFSRKAVIEPRRIDLNELVTKSAKLLRRLIGEDISFVVVTAPEPLWITADPGQLEQVVMNLVVNARDAMPMGGRLLIELSKIVSTADDSSPKYARLSVKDTGEGMSEEVKEKIFEPFFTTKSVGQGTGLGLAVVHGVVSQSGGQITIESRAGVGTSFHVLWPLVEDHMTSVVSELSRISTRGTETILLVEDDKAVRTIARIALQTQGYTVLESGNGADALQQVQSFPHEIHLLVSDVVMPEMGGRQLLEAVRKCRPGLRVLFVSGYTDDAVLLHGVIDATDAFLQKPFTPLSLAQKVRELLDGPALGRHDSNP